MFGYVSDVVAMADLSEERHAKFAEFCDGAVAAVAWTSFINDEEGHIGVVRDGEHYSMVDELPEWQDDDGDIQDVVHTVNVGGWFGFFTENYVDLLSCSTDFGQHGHDYVLTAGRHGAGFWDRGYAKGVADRLTESAQGGTASHSFWFEGEVLRYEQV